MLKLLGGQKQQTDRTWSSRQKMPNIFTKTQKNKQDKKREQIQVLLHLQPCHLGNLQYRGIGHTHCGRQWYGDRHSRGGQGIWKIWWKEERRGGRVTRIPDSGWEGRKAGMGTVGNKAIGNKQTENYKQSNVLGIGNTIRDKVMEGLHQQGSRKYK